MTLLNQSELDAVAEAINKVEQTTDAELVTVLARAADDYYYIPTLWAAVLALLSLPVLSLFPITLDYNWLPVIQVALFATLTIVFRTPAIMMRLVPQAIKNWRAANLARRQFLEQNLHHTKGDTGVLIFIAEAEHYVEIIADRGISQHVDNQQWQAVIDQFTAAVKADKTQQGLIACIEQCGELLNQYAPASEAKNELPNHLIII